MTLSEEENLSDNTEISKKDKESNDTSGDDDTGDDDTDEKKFDDDKVTDSFNQNYFSKLTSLNAFYIKSNIYKYPDQSVSTPPPKI
jgi:hypothetical protein